MNLHYDRQGKPMDLMTWAKLMEDREYKIVARHDDERVMISTVWLGLDHNFGGGKPLIFETMVFVNSDALARGDIDPKYNQLCWRWHTEEEAKKGHEIIVHCYHEGKDPPDDLAP